MESAEDQAHLLLEAEEPPYAMDDATVARLIRVYSEQAADHWLFEEQLRRWGAGPLSPEQRQEVERLSQTAARLKQVTTAILLMGEWSLALAAPRLAAVAVYLHVGFFGATLVSGFWSVINESFDPYTARHVIGRIGTGAGVGGVVGGLLTWRAAALVGIAPMLLVIVGLTLACLVVLENLHRTDRGRVPTRLISWLVMPAATPTPAQSGR